MCDVQQQYQLLSDQVVETIPKYRDSRPSQRAKAPWNELLNKGITAIAGIPVADFASRMNSLIAFKPSIEAGLVAATSFLPDDAQLVERYYLFYNGLSAIPNCKTCGIQLKPKNRFRLTDTASTKAGYGTYCDKKCASSDPEVIQQRKATNIERRGVDVPAKSKEVQAKMQATNLERHGVKAPVQNEEIKAKQAKTNLERYGVESASPLASKQIQAKAKDSIRGKYGVDNVMEVQALADKAGDGKRKHAYAQLHNEERVGRVKPLFTEDEYLGVLADRVTGMPHRYPWECLECGTEFVDGVENDKSLSGGKPRCPSCYPKVISYGEREIYKTVKASCPEGAEIKQGDRELLNGREVDILVPSLKLAIEYNGIYWHSAYAGEKDKDYHQSKLEELNKRGYRLMYVWEDELYQNPTAIKQMVSEACGGGKVIDASKADVIQGNSTSDGMEVYHREGSLGGKIGVFSLVFEEEVVATLQVAQRPKKKKDEVNRASIRYKALNGFKVVNGFERLFAESVKRNTVDKVYEIEVDPSFDDVSIYEKSGFELTKEKAHQMWFLARPMKYRNRLPKAELVKRVQAVDPTFNILTTLHDSRLKSLDADRVWGVKRQVWQLEVKKS